MQLVVQTDESVSHAASGCVVCRYSDLHNCRAAHRVKRQDSFLLRYRHLDFECALGRVYKFNMACWPSVNTNHAIRTHLRDYKRGSVDKIRDVFSEEDELKDLINIILGEMLKFLCICLTVALGVVLSIPMEMTTLRPEATTEDTSGRLLTLPDPEKCANSKQ